MHTKAYSEVSEILNLISYDLKSRIPKSFLDFIENEKDKNYNPKFDKNVPLEKQSLKEETIHILALLKLKYWCNDEEKLKFSQMLNENERKFQKEINEKYNLDNLFKENKTQIKKKDGADNIEEQYTEQITDMVEHEENIFIKLIKKAKRKIKGGKIWKK